MDNDPWAVLVGHPPEYIMDYTIHDLISDEANVSFYLPCMWSDGEHSGDGIGNPCPDDPMTIYWTADLIDGEDGITYKTTLTSLIDDVIDMHVLMHETPKVIEDSSVPLFISMREALQKEIDKLNFCVDNAKPDGKDK